MNFDDLPGWLSVSRETFERLLAFESLVKKWNPAINLVAKASVPAIWPRHILDSAQLYPLVAPPMGGLWVDVGAGGGFPGLVMAVLAAELRPDIRFVMVESDRRKSVFLSEASRSLGLTARVEVARAESVAPLGADVLSARALAPLSDLCLLAHRHLSKDGVALFLKGQGADQELGTAKQRFTFREHLHISRTDPAGTIVELRGLAHV